MARRSNLPPGVCRLTMCPWDGAHPLPGHYLATRNGRTAYLILGIKPRTKAGGFVVEVERHAKASIPDDAVVQWFVWNKR